jgi:hypothetical protein
MEGNKKLTKGKLYFSIPFSKQIKKCLLLLDYYSVANTFSQFLGEPKNKFSQILF